MKIILNLLPISSGGGQQVALTFLKSLHQKEESKSTIVLAKEGTEVSYWLRQQDSFKYFLSGKSAIRRIVFELLTIPKLIAKHQIDILYTFFGTIFIKPNVKIVTGCAYSNLFYPEIDFWRVNFFPRLKHTIIDAIRLWSYRIADVVIFENQALADKSMKEFGFKNSKVILPSISFKSEENSPKGLEQVEKIDKSTFNFLILSGWHVNKNISLLINVANELQLRKVDNIRFVLSIRPDDSSAKHFIETIKKYNLDRFFNFVGKVSATDVEYIVKACDSMLLLSTLESFSNNVIEAWSYGRPLVITDAEWSRAVCKNAAAYVDIKDVLDITDKLMEVASDSILVESLISKGIERLTHFPSPIEKVDLHLELLYQILEND